jgi:AbrB family looped-hinge helix DNA binding protein
MTHEVVVTRKGQTTIPIELRRKYGLEEGSRLEVRDTGRGILLKPKQSFLDMAGPDSGVATVKEMKELLDRMRAEDA